MSDGEKDLSQRKIGFDRARLEDKILVDDDDYLVMPAVIASEIIHKYDNGLAYKSADELQKATETAREIGTLPVTILKHPDTGLLVRGSDVYGRAENIRFRKDLMDPKTKRPMRRGTSADIRWFKKRMPETVLAAIYDKSMMDVSIGFTYEEDQTPGEWNGEKYDYAQKNIWLDHVAGPVEAGRCPSPMCGIGVDAVLGQTRVAGDPWEETEEYIRSGHREQGNPCRTTTLSEEQGIKAIVCKYGEKWEIRSYLFAKAKEWTMEKAKAWFKAHQDVAPPKGADAMSLADVDKKILELQTKLNDLQAARTVKQPQPDPESEKAWQEIDALREEIRAWQQAKVSLIVKEATGDCGLCDEAEKIGLSTALRRINVVLVAHGEDAIKVIRGEEAPPAPKVEVDEIKRSADLVTQFNKLLESAKR